MKQQIQHPLHVAANPKHDEESVQVAFSVASHSNFGPLETDETVPFEIVYTNVGGRWWTGFNVFQAEVAGVYQFTVSTRHTPSGSSGYRYCHVIHTNPEAGETIVASTGGYISSSSSYSNTGDANSVILELGAGDVVFVRLQEDGALLSDSTYVFSTFSGFLLFQ